MFKNQIFSPHFAVNWLLVQEEWKKNILNLFKILLFHAPIWPNELMDELIFPMSHIITVHELIIQWT